ncbi:MAG: DNA double-strand break repair nuclease NurA [Nanoarchaeota archaeon]|nr:DNA double-strand break repair nuclease NurA [Nanoarchaeota archaeon]
MLDKMNKRIINKVIESIGATESAQAARVSFSDSRYKSIDFSKDNFRQIIKFENKDNARKIAFVDGGNAEIVGAPNFSFQLVRTYYSIWQDNKRIKNLREDFFVFVNAFSKNERGQKYIKYSAQMFKNDLTTKSVIEKQLNAGKSSMPDDEEIVYDSFDATIMDGVHRASPGRVAEVARRFAEIKACELASEELNSGDLIVIDGTLQSSVTNESKQLSRLYESVSKRNVILCALAKTTTLLTETGDSVIFSLGSIAPKTSWYYHPVVEITHPDHKAEMFIVKLHDKSKHIFRLEMHHESFLKNMRDVSNLIAVLASNCKDPVFVGYPYGLIEADANARISNQEVKNLRTQLMFQSGKKWDDISDRLSSVDAHSILDSK